MPIEELADEHLVQRCAHCAAQHTIKHTAITAGVAAPAAPADAAVVALPACANCGAQEFLLRSPVDAPEHPAPGSYGHLHRLLVDCLHARLVARGRVAKELRKAGGVTAVPVDEGALARWFPAGLRLPASGAEPPAPKAGPA
jgi:hypothetical protein